MAQDNRVYVTGHQKPDTDCIVSAIGYAFFKRAQGMDAVPCRLGRVNVECKYLLKRFHFKKPHLLETARVNMNEIDLDEPISISEDTSILEAVRKMEENGRESFGITDEKGCLIGWISKSDIARLALGDTQDSRGILRDTPTEYFAASVNGKVIYDDPERNIDGAIGILTRNNEEKLIDCDARGRIVISGNEKHAMVELIRQGAGMLVLLKNAEVDEEVLKMAREYHCPIVISGCGAMNTSRYLYLAPPVKYIMRRKVVCFYTNEIADDVSKKLSASRFRSYPVVDLENHLVGYVTRYHMMNYHNKRMILIDHNQFQESVSGIVDAPVLEVIDHHRVADFSTPRPVDFRNEIVGATSTIIATIFRENMVPFTRELAGLLLGGILSETVNLQTPTTTQRDIETANILAAIADLRLEDFARELFSLDTEVREKMVNEMISHDMIFRNIAGLRTVFGRVNVSDIQSYRQDTLDIRIKIKEYCENTNMDICVLAFVSALENGCILYTAGDKAKWVHEAFPDKEGEENSFQEGIVSRTSQIIPRVTEVIEKYML